MYLYTFKSFSSIIPYYFHFLALVIRKSTALSSVISLSTPMSRKLSEKWVIECLNLNISSVYPIMCGIQRESIKIGTKKHGYRKTWATQKIVPT